MESMESQNTEWKATWRDEYLKGVCAFANAQGGVIEIGKDNKGRIVGLADAERLLQDLPNKIRNTMGIIADVDLTRKGGLAIIRISVKPHPFPISYHGKYYYRSGSTTQELSGYALDEFMLKKTGQNLGRSSCAVCFRGGFGQCRVTGVPPKGFCRQASYGS
jgi:ATP-dependent DNA helicase RecG